MVVKVDGNEALYYKYIVGCLISVVSAVTGEEEEEEDEEAEEAVTEHDELTHFMQELQDANTY